MDSLPCRGVWTVEKWAIRTFSKGSEMQQREKEAGTRLERSQKYALEESPTLLDRALPAGQSR